MAQDEDTADHEQTVTEKGNEQAAKAQITKGTHAQHTGKNSSISISEGITKHVSQELSVAPINEEIIVPVKREEACSARSVHLLANASPARAVSSQTPKELHQQFRLLHSQELIRRILQSTGVLPNNLAQNNSFEATLPVKREENQDSAIKEETQKETVVKAETTSSQKAVKTLKKSDTKEQRPKDFCDNSLECKKSQNQEEKKREEVTDMESDISFVCSVCSCRQDGGDKDLNTSTGTFSVNSLDTIEQDVKMTKQAVVNPPPLAVPSKVKNRGSPNVEELSERLHRQPSHEMLDEILRLLQNQTQHMQAGDSEKDENQNTVKKTAKKTTEALQQTNVKNPLESLYEDESIMEDEWKQQQQKLMMMRSRPNLREKHSRQLTDMKNYYENEIGKLRDQLEHLRGNLSNLQEAIPLKMLESANQKLESRCHLMEEVVDELKTKCQKLEQTNGELEKSCQELRESNEALEMRCIFLQKSFQDSEEKQSELLNKNKILESKALHLTKVNEVNTKNCKQLEETSKTFEKACKQLEESNEKLEIRYRKCKEENLKLSADVRDLQESLQTSRKHAEEQKNVAAALEKEKADWALKLDLAQKMTKGAQSRYEEMKIEKNEKEATINKMEEQMAILTASCEKAAKTKSELEENAERDRELLKRLLTEYDALVKENQKLKDSVSSLTNKFDISQDEINDLRGTINTLIHRNTNLEESLKETLSRSINKSTPETGPRKTWDSPSTLKQPQYVSQLSLSTFDSIFDGSSTPVKDDDTEAQQSTTPPSVKFEIPWERPKSSTPTKSNTKRNLDKSYNKPSPNNLVVKKSDLVTRFDVVFEDSESGAEVKRTHTGRTSRSQGESPTSIFVSNSVPDVNESSQSNRMLSNAAEAALTALKSGRVVSQGDWEGSKSTKARKEKKGEKRKTRQSKPAHSDDTERSDRENEVSKLERKFSSLTEEKLRLESTLSRIPTHRVTKRSKDDKAFLENRLDEVIQDIGSVRMQLRQLHAL